MKIIAKAWFPHTISSPAMVRYELEDGRVINLQGKAAKRANEQYRIGDNYDADQ